MPLMGSRDLNSAPRLTEEEQKLRDKAKRKFRNILDDAGDEREAVLLTVLKDIGPKDYGNGDVDRFLCRLVILTGEHEGHVEQELPVVWKGWTNKIRKAYEQEGLGVHIVSRLERYGDRNPKAIGLTDNEDSDIPLAEKALEKHGDPLSDAAPGKLAAEVDAAKKSVKDKVAAGKAAAAGDDDPPF